MNVETNIGRAMRIVTVLEWDRKRQDWRRLTLDLDACQPKAERRDAEEDRQQEEWIVRRRRAKKHKGEKRGAMVTESCMPRAKHFRADRHRHTVCDWTGERVNVTFETFRKIETLIGGGESVTTDGNTYIYEQPATGVWTVGDAENIDRDIPKVRTTIDRTHAKLRFATAWRNYTVNVTYSSDRKTYLFSVTLEGRPVVGPLTQRQMIDWTQTHWQSHASEARDAVNAFHERMKRVVERRIVRRNAPAAGSVRVDDWLNTARQSLDVFALSRQWSSQYRTGWQLCESSK